MAKRAANQQATLFDVSIEETTPPAHNGSPPVVESQPAEPLPPAEPKTPTVYVVDSHSLIYQVFHAVPEMSSPSGQPVGAVHGFIRDVLDLLDKKKPDYLFCAFDYSGTTFRNALYDQYKAKREEMPIDLRPQIENIRRLLRAMNVPVLELDQYEADDILATIAQLCDERGWDCFLVTGDKDCRQLISEHVQVYNIRKQELMNAEGLMVEWGIRPDQVVDFQALVGDAVDNVPGVPLIGPKIAKELITQYGTLEAVLENAANVPGKKRSENLLNFKDQALLSRDLVRLKRDVPIEIDWEHGRVGGVKREEVAALCLEFGFRKLAEQLGGLTVAELKPPSAKWQSNYRTIATPQALAELVATLEQQTIISVDTETTST
ncbi:MAG TPA: 5'-3' exonuclease H3TH domain-containing protein, partial [Pirellulaceae bacterium]|nr:5'-3' exonuclease H3TH domain-containing protein [Pirellulaceae bacterium]